MKRLGGAALLLLAAWLVFPALVLNLGALHLRDLAMDRRVETVPWVVRELPLVKETPRGVWLTTRIARTLEVKASPVRLPLPADARASIAAGYAKGDLHPYTRLEAELIAWSCLPGTPDSGPASILERCRERLRRDRPDVAPAVSTGVVAAQYVDELNASGGAHLGAALASGTMGCSSGLEFLRQWVHRDGSQGAQIAAARSLADACPGLAEAHFYHARAADLNGQVTEAAAAYERGDPGRHPEAAFWRTDFLSRQQRTAPAAESTGPPRQVFGASSLPARFEDGTPMGPESLVRDTDAAGIEVRRAAKFGAVLAYGPYVKLPYGRYRVIFFLKSAGAAGAGRVARLDVREDSESWRPYFWSRILAARQAGTPGVERIVHEFTSTGEGTFSVAVVTLTNSPVAFARVELERVGRP